MTFIPRTHPIYSPSTTITSSVPRDKSKNVDTDPNPINLRPDRESLQPEAGKGKETKINWLGSSYSGADIKVIAHLYQSDYKIVSDMRIRLETLAGIDHAMDVFINTTLGASNLSQLSFTSDPAGELIRKTTLNYQAFTAEVNDLIRGLVSIAISNGGDLSAAIGRAHQYKNKGAVERDKINEKLKYLDKEGITLNSTLTLGGLQTISVQSHREKSPVRAIGMSHVKGHVWGPRTFAGTMIFTTFQEHPLRALISEMARSGTHKTWADKHLSSLVSDQIPPVDLTIVFANEYGSISRMGIYGVEFFSDAITFSSEDLFSENVLNYMARDVDIMTEVGRMQFSRAEGRIENKEGKPVSASELLYNNRNAYNKYVTESLNFRREFRGI